jgi:hypothetical protein
MFSQVEQIITKKITDVNEENILQIEISPDACKGKTWANITD